MALTRSGMVTPADCIGARLGTTWNSGTLPALHQHRAHAVYAIKRGLQDVISQLPKLRLRNRVGREAVAQDGEGGEGEAVVRRW